MPNFFTSIKNFLDDGLFGDKAEPPPVPNYVDATKTGIETDLATLPLRNAINAATQLGTKYTDPNTGRVYDFSGLGQADINAADMMKQLEMAPEVTRLMLELQQKYGTQFAEEARRQLMATDPEGFALRENLAKKLQSGDGNIESLFTGQEAPVYEGIDGNGPTMGRIDASQNPQFERLDALPQFQSVDTRSLPTTQTVGAAPQYSTLDLSSLPQFAGVNGVSLADRGPTAAGRADLERQIMDELTRAGSGQIDPLLATAAQQASRARGAASGNTLGDSSALQESLAVQLAQRQRNDQSRSNALQLLASGQSTSDKGNALSLDQLAADLQAQGFNNAGKQQAFQNTAAATGFNNDAASRSFDNSVTAAGFNNAAGLDRLQAEIAAKAFNNTGAQQGYENQANNTATNNAGRQQTFQNQVAGQAFNNDAASAEFNNVMSALNQRNQSKQNSFQAQQGLLQQQAGARQQDLGNVQSFLGLQPIVSQGGQLSGLQSGAAPFMQGGNYSATGVNPNAGQQGAAFAGNIFGTQAGLFPSIVGQNSGRSFLTAFSKISGGAANMAGAGMFG